MLTTVTDPIGVQVSDSKDELGSDGPRGFNREHVIRTSLLGCSNAAGRHVLDQADVATIGSLVSEFVKKAHNMTTSFRAELDNRRSILALLLLEYSRASRIFRAA